MAGFAQRKPPAQYGLEGISLPIRLFTAMIPLPLLTRKLPQCPPPAPSPHLHSVVVAPIDLLADEKAEKHLKLSRDMGRADAGGARLRA